MRNPNPFVDKGNASTACLQNSDVNALTGGACGGNWLGEQTLLRWVVRKRLVSTVVGGDLSTQHNDVHHFRFDGHHFVVSVNLRPS